MTRPMRLDDAALGERIASYRTHKANEKAEEALAESDRDAICAELAARKVKVFELDGLRTTMSKSKRVVSLEQARVLLSRAMFKRVTKTVVVMDEWNTAKKAGQISDAQDQASRIEQRMAPHIYVNPIGQAKRAA